MQKRLMRNNSPHFKHPQCKFCNDWFSHGLARLNHQKICGMRGTVREGVETMLETGLEPPENVEEEFIDGQPCYESNEGLRSDLLEHFGRLSRHGTICEDAIGLYSNMPRRALSPVETAVYRFLQALDCGTGVSKTTMQGFLT